MRTWDCVWSIGEAVVKCINFVCTKEDPEVDDKDDKNPEEDPDEGNEPSENIDDTCDRPVLDPG